MTHLCCSACRVRFDKAHVAPATICPHCDGPLAEHSPSAALGFMLSGTEVTPGLSHAALAAALRKPSSPPPVPRR
ncbi:MAG: hypothetical protein AVDCRST_MAG85-2059 [uncultured Solirubrobacteraceae bacterium]|uniref:Uncharacterized protein n=1 Tax=uncultured Solirubrobacteraceae bacterium TaxID=1162706 RepID=A0A6J4SVJ9_9ACTN|nr:MAG: hypothetical protein AVDCRST_MAG85-2059 [uncultured Solirubrobacteraceae bacterium]